MIELTIRPHSWDLPLFFHIAGALALIAALVAGFCVLVVAWRSDGDTRTRLSSIGFRTLLYAAIPSYLVMRIAAQLVVSKEHLDDSTAEWLNLAYPFTDGAGALLLIATILTGLGARRQRRGGGFGLAAAATVLTGIALVSLVVVIWAMTTKPI